MDEEPNLIFLNQLSNGDEIIKNKLLMILKEEFIEEFKEYNLNIINNNFSTASQNVHKIRHKIGFLGMQASFDLSNQYQENLEVNSTALKDEFEIILNIIYEFVIKNHTS